MAINSRLVVTIYEGNRDVYPNNNGVLEIVKTYASEYVVARFQKRFDDDFGKKYFIDSEYLYKRVGEEYKKDNEGN